MSDQDHTRDPLPKVENENIKDHNHDLETAAPPLSVGTPAFSPPAGEGADLQEGADAPETGNLTPETAGGAKLPGLCHHRMESGYYCQSPAVHDRHFCYSHLRLRGQRIRMARAIARRLPYRFDLPALDDLYAVQSAVEHVGRALGAGLMKREEANSLLWMLQQSAINHRNLALARMNAVDPTLSPRDGEKVPALSLSKGGALALETGNLKLETAGGQKRLVEDYPEFEAEFGLPAGIDVSQPAHALFPPPEDQWRVPTPARDPKTSPWCHRQPGKHWTKEEIEREELEKKARTMGEHAYLREAEKLNERVARQMRKCHEAACQAEADRRNAALKERELQFGSMNEGERQAYNLGILRAMEAVQEQEEEREKWRKEYADKAS